MTLEENYLQIISSIKALLITDEIEESTKKSLEMLIFKIEDEKNDNEMMSIIVSEFNITGSEKESPIELLKAKKQKLTNLFKKNLNYI